MTEEETRRNTEQTSPRLPARQTLSRLSYSPTLFQANGRKSVAPSLASPDPYNKHRLTPSVPAAVLAVPPVPAAARSSFPAPARKVSHPKLSERAGEQSSLHVRASVGKGGASETLVQPVSLSVLRQGAARNEGSGRAASPKKAR